MSAEDRLEDVTSAVVKATKTYVRAVGIRLADLGLQPGQDVLLSFLWKKDGLSATDIVEKLHVEPPTVTKGLARLEKLGLVTRRRDARDARVSRVYLTARGRRLREPVQAIWKAVRAEAYAGMSPAEQETLRALASRMLENLRAAFPELVAKGRALAK